MIERKRRITFRLSFEEEARYQPLMREMYCYDWSKLVRLSLERLFKSREAERPITLSDTPKRVRHKPVGRAVVKGKRRK